MKAVYDFTVSPTQWDFSTALVTMEIARIAAGAEDIEILFRPGEREGFRNNDAWPSGTAERQLMMDRVLLPLAALLPSVASASWWRGPAHAIAHEFGFGMRLYGVPAFMAALKSPHGRPLVAPPADVNPHLVTMTLREAPHWPARNSDLAEWLVAARQLRAEGLQVVIVRDTAKAREPLEGQVTAPGASEHLHVRAALYARAAANLFVSNGPLALALYANLPALAFKMINPAHRAQTVEYMASHGLPVGGQFPGSPDWQRIVWEPLDTADVIVRETLWQLKNQPARPCRTAA